MADVNPPNSQVDSTRAFAGSAYTPNGLHQTYSSGPSHLDSDGMQYFDFDAFGHDAHDSHAQLLRGAHGVGDDDPDSTMPADRDPIKHSAFPPDKTVYEEDYDDAIATEQSTLADYEEVSEQDGSDDEHAAVLHAALESYYSINPLHSRLVPSPPKYFEQHMFHPEEATGQRLSTSIEAFAGNEKWHVDKESAEFLASVMSLASNNTVDETLQRSIRNPLRDLKLEEPILDTDPQMAIIKLFERNEVHLSSEGIAECALDDEKDESLKWSQQALQLPNTIRAEIMSAKLEVDAETLKYLYDIDKGPKVDPDDWLKQDREKRLPPGPASPKLVHLSPPYSPEDVDPAAAVLELTSSAEDPSRQEANTIMKSLMERDDLAMQRGAEEAASFFDDFPTSSSSPCRRRVKRLRSLKASSPLLPLVDAEEPQAKKARTVCFSNELETVIPQPSEESIDPQDFADDLLASIRPFGEPARDLAQQQLSAEELVEMDTTLRIPVPTIEDIRPTPPWEIYASGECDKNGLNLQCRLIEDTCDNLSRSETKWSVSSKSEQALQWLPFPRHLGKPKPEGGFDDGSLARYLTELNLDGDVDLERLIWKPDGLRLLDNDEFEDDELDVAEPGVDVDVADTDVVASVPGPVPARLQLTPHAHTKPSVPRDRTSDTREWSSMDSLLQKRTMQLHGEGVSSGRKKTGLDMFAKVHGLIDVVAPARTTDASSIQGHNTEQSTSMPHITEAPFVQPQSVIHEVEIPLPEIHASAGPLQVIMSYTWMQNHHFVRRLQKLLADIDIIERDFTYSSSEAETRKPSHANADLEADITMSPSTGIMFTNLQKLKQKALPGQGASFGIREHIAVVAARYERLIVLVGDLPTLDDGEALLHIMDVNDSAALANLINQTAMLETDVEVIYVAGGIDRLVKWTAATISRNASSDHKLLREETLWERFLRKAGMNAYAAQAVLDSAQATLKAAGLVDDSLQGASPADTVESALSAFVKMGPEQRIQYFGPVIGGDRLLRRVNRMLDAEWMS